MITEEQIENNKKEFLELIDQITIEGADIEGLKNYLCNSDFFIAPASTIYHCGYKGGLCQHSLNVYYNLLYLVDIYKDIIPAYDRNSYIIVGLLHDLAKTDFYEPYVVNKKVYDERGTKHDNLGKFDWFAEEAYKVKDVSERFVAGEHGTNSMFLAGKYIPMNMEESLAIMHHHFITEAGKPIMDLSAIYNKYPLCTLLHTADMLSTYITERK